MTSYQQEFFSQKQLSFAYIAPIFKEGSCLVEKVLIHTENHEDENIAYNANASDVLRLVQELALSLVQGDPSGCIEESKKYVHSRLDEGFSVVDALALQHNELVEMGISDIILMKIFYLAEIGVSMLGESDVPKYVLQAVRDAYQVINFRIEADVEDTMFYLLALIRATRTVEKK